jgi:hypothetical protein
MRPELLRPSAVPATCVSSAAAGAAKKRRGSVIAGESGGASGWIHARSYLFGALRRDGLIADELVLQRSTFLGSLDLFLELRARALPRSRLARDEPRRGSHQRTNGHELSHFHSSTQHRRENDRRGHGD